MSETQLIRPERVWTPGGLLAHQQVSVRGGEIVAVERTSLAPNYPGRLLLPGFVNGHSHAFQRVIRGRVQSVPAHTPEADFWSWRERMYRAAEGLDAEGMYEVSRFCFLEMLAAGFTSVGEFHYVHHQPDGTPYPRPQELSLQVARAARDVGIRCVLLPVAYHRAGFGVGANPRQRRFLHPDPDTFLRFVEDLQKEGIPCGVAIHSIRAVPRPWLEEVSAWAHNKGVLLHIHAAEQTGEIEQCQAEYGMRVVEVLGEAGVLGPGTTLVHGIHLSEGEMEQLVKTGTRVCACPTTERDLGDGVIPAAALWKRGVSLSIGTDSHATIDPFAEMVGLEGHERLIYRRRCLLLGEASGGEREVATSLLHIATRGGALSLGFQGGEIRPGYVADLVTVDLDHLTLEGWDDDTLLSMLALAGHPALIREVMVGGQMVLEGGRHRQAGDIRDHYRARVRQLYEAN